MSNLDKLSPLDFEDLCRDIAQKQLNIRFSAFGSGADKGIDGRHSNGQGEIILQCKHYIGSKYSHLKSSAKEEAQKVETLNPRRYLFFTSLPLSPRRSDELAKIFHPFIKEKGDIWGKEDIESFLRNNPEILKSHIKLWLSDTVVLEKILHSGLEAFTNATKDEILEEVKVYARNSSFDEAIEKLEKEKILIISGPPGVGKTTLAKMVTYNYLNNGWQFYAINSLEDGFAKINDHTPTVFFFDDFLGRIELDKQSLLQRDSSLAVFVKRIKKSKNARFVLTTRAHIFEEARQLSDHLDDRRVQLYKYLLDVGAYTRKIKAHIFFNHLIVSDLSNDHFNSLLKDEWLPKIIDHKNYNPRVIASVSSDCVDITEPCDYPEYIYNALNNPNLIWSKPFKSLDIKSQNLLIALFFCSTYMSEIDDLRKSYLSLHREFCIYYRQPINPNDFEEAVKALESGFISISGNLVNFVNPSVRDFLKSYLIHKEILEVLTRSTVNARFADNVWKHIKNKFTASEQKKFALLLKNFASNIGATPTMKQVKKDDAVSYKVDDISLTDRGLLLFEWWEHSHDDFFIEKIINLLQNTSLIFRSWLEASSLPELYYKIVTDIDDHHHLKLDATNAIEDKILGLFNNWFSIDDLISFMRSFNELMPDTTPKNIKNLMDQAVNYECTETYQAITHLETEDDLNEHLASLEELEKITDCDIEQAKATISQRIDELHEEYIPEQESSLPSRNKLFDETFSDDDLKSLFSNLIK